MRTRLIDEFGRVHVATDDGDGNLYMPSRGIEQAVLRQENKGLESLVKYDRIPRKEVVEFKEVLEKMGFQLVKPTEGDDLFHDVTIPTGWSKEHDPEDHRSMFFLDANKNRRFLVWYKAASYDRAAYGYPLRRFDLSDRSHNDYTQVQAFLSDQKTPGRKPRVIFATERRTIKGIKERESASQEEKAKVLAWAASQGIDVKDPCAHWEDADLPTVCDFPPYR